MTEGIKLTQESQRLFLRFVEESYSYGGMPILDVSEDEKGNLTDLKKKELIETEADGDDPSFSWVIFTPAGFSLAAQMGHDIPTEAYGG